jgi:nicotinate-nucleotide adenylyltransferase
MTSPEPAGSGRGAIGILGGTFDPVHLGHLALAAEALSLLDLEQVLFVPNADPPHKQAQRVTAALHREAMVALAIVEDQRLTLDRIELERPGPSYAVDTVAALADRCRVQGRPEPWFVLSAEVLEDFHTWRQPERVLELCRVAVAPRPGAEPLDRGWVTQNYPGREDRFAFLPGPELDIASTVIRARVRAGRSVAELVPAAVLEYIGAHALYQPEQGVAT